MEKEIVITITKKNSNDLIARVFNDESGCLKAIVDDDYVVEIEEKTHPA